MNDREYGKKLQEETIFEHFEVGYLAVTGRAVGGAGRSESPDFMTDIDGVETGVEVAEVPYTRGRDAWKDGFDAHDYWAHVWRLVDKKNSSYVRHGRFTIPIILVLYSANPALFDVKELLDSAVWYDDYNGLDFSQIWVMDMSDEYCSLGDPRRPPDMWGLKPARWRGFHRYGRWSRKPYG